MGTERRPRGSERERPDAESHYFLPAGGLTRKFTSIESIRIWGVSPKFLYLLKLQENLTSRESQPESEYIYQNNDLNTTKLRASPEKIGNPIPLELKF